MGQSTTNISINDISTLLMAANSNAKTLSLTNTGSSTIFVGTDGSVTDANGFPVYAGEQLKANDYIGVWYGICSSGETSTIRIDVETI